MRRLFTALLIVVSAAAQSLQRGQNSTNFGQGTEGKTGPVDWVRDDNAGFKVMLEKNGHYTDGTFLGRGPDGSDYFRFAGKCYRLSVPQKRPGQNHGAGVLGGLGRMAGPWGGVAGQAADRASAHHPAPQSDVEFTEIPAGEVPPASFLSTGRTNAPSQGVPVLTEFKDAKGAVTRTLELPNSNQAFVVTNALCFGADAYVNPVSPSIVYVLSRDPQTHAVTGYKQITNAGKDCAVQIAPAPASTPAPADPPKPSYMLNQIDGDQYRLVYSENGKKQDLMVMKLKDKLYCSNMTSPPKSYIVEADGSLTVLNSDQSMIIKCQMQANKAYEQPQK